MHKMHRKPDKKSKKANHAATNVSLTYHVISLNWWSGYNF